MNALSLAGTVMALLAGQLQASGDEYPLRRLKSLTYVVDYEPFWSPDGRSIAIISSRAKGMKLFTMPSSGGDMRQVTTGEAEDDTPAWSPDGKEIAFVSIRNGQSDIFVVKTDGSGVRQVTTGKGENIHPGWSPDGKWILFDTTRFVEAGAGKGKGIPGGNQYLGEKIDEAMDLATIRPDGTDLRRLTTGGGYTYAFYSPDGGSIVHRRIQGKSSQVYVMKADGTEDHNISGASTDDGWPSWSFDGRLVVFARRVGDRFQIFVVDRNGKNTRQLTDAEGSLTNPRWSPDGKTILCSRRLGGNITLLTFDAPP